MAIDPSDMNDAMRRATNGTRMRIPAMGANPQKGLPPAYSTGSDTRLAQAAQQATPNIMPPRQPGQVQPRQAPQPSVPQQGWTPPPGLMNPAVSQPQQGPLPSQPSQPSQPAQRPPGQPMPQQPGQMGTGFAGVPGQPPPPRHTILPPGVAARPDDYAYEPQPDRTWKMYPPGVPSPPHGDQASMPRAASTADLARMAQELGPYMQRREQLRLSTQAPIPPGLANPNANPNEVQGY